MNAASEKYNMKISIKETEKVKMNKTASQFTIHIKSSEIS